MDRQRGYMPFPRPLVTDTPRCAELLGLLMFAMRRLATIGLKFRPHMICSPKTNYDSTGIACRSGIHYSTRAF